MIDVPNPWVVLEQSDLLLVRWPIAQRGRYYHHKRTIVVRRGLLLVEERAVLWHELVHARRGDLRCCMTYFAESQERSVDREAARWAMPLPAMLAAYQWARCDAEAADELKTTQALLDVRLKAMHPSERAALARARQRREGAA